MIIKDYIHTYDIYAINGKYSSENNWLRNQKVFWELVLDIQKTIDSLSCFIWVKGYSQHIYIFKRSKPNSVNVDCLSPELISNIIGGDWRANAYNSSCAAYTVDLKGILNENK